MQFKVGETVVHLSHGIGTVTGIEEREFPNGKQTFYIVTIPDNGAPKKVFVPVASETQRLRKVITRKQAEEVLALVAFGKVDNGYSRTWTERYRGYMEAIHTGDAIEIAKVYVALRQLAQEKDLSFGERKLAEQAKTLIVTELTTVGVRIPTELE